MSVLSGTPLDQLEERHLSALIENATSEQRDIEFKQARVGDTDKDKKEFLKDVTSMANTDGGDLVIGLAEDNGVAVSLPGIETPPADGEILRLEAILSSSIEPRLFGVRIKEISLSQKGYALVVRIPRSWNPPHRVTYKGSSRYYLRHSNGSFEPSVAQLRSVFLGGADSERRLVDFRLDRLARLSTGERGLPLTALGKLVVHAVPLSAGETSFVLPSPETAVFDFLPRGTHSSSHRINLEGLLYFAVAGDVTAGAAAYTQVFRDGRVEMASGGFVRAAPLDYGGGSVVSAQRLAGSIVSYARKCVSGLCKYGASFPMALMVSFLDARGTRLVPSNDYLSRTDILDRSDLIFAPVVVEDGNISAIWDSVLLPILDGVWQAYGRPCCDSVRNQDGSWRGVPSQWLS